MANFKYLLTSILLFLTLALFSGPSFSATYTQHISVSFGQDLTGQATNVRLTVYDKDGTVQIATTNTPSGNTIAESTDASNLANTGSYWVRITVDTAWLPIKTKWTIVGQAGVVAEAILGSDKAALLADGLSSTKIANLDVAVSSRGTSNYTGSDSSGVTTLLTRIPGIVQPQTGDSYSLIGTAGAGLTALGDTRLSGIKAKTDLIATNAGDSPNTVTSQSNTATAASSNSTSNIQSSVTSALTSQGLTVARAAKLDNLDVTVSSRNSVVPDNTSLAGIKAKTDNLPSDPASNTQVLTRFASSSFIAPDNTSIASIKTKTDNLPMDPASTTQVLTRLATSGYVAPDNLSIAGIKTKTDALPTDPASNTQVLTRLASSDYVVPDSSTLLSIKAKTDNLPSDPASNTQVLTRMASFTYVAPDNTSVLAIKSKTDKIGTEDANSPNLVSALTSIAGISSQTNPSNIQSALTTALTNQGYTTARAALLSNVDVSVSSRLSAVAFAAVPVAPSTSDIITAVANITIDGTMTMRQYMAIQVAITAGRLIVSPLNKTTHVQTTTYYRQDNTTLLSTATTTYDENNVRPISRTVVFYNLP